MEERLVSLPTRIILADQAPMESFLIVDFIFMGLAVRCMRILMMERSQGKKDNATKIEFYNHNVYKIEASTPTTLCRGFYGM